MRTEVWSNVQIFLILSVLVNSEQCFKFFLLKWKKFKFLALKFNRFTYKYLLLEVKFKAHDCELSRNEKEVK